MGSQTYKRTFYDRGIMKAKVGDIIKKEYTDGGFIIGRVIDVYEDKNFLYRLEIIIDKWKWKSKHINLDDSYKCKSFKILTEQELKDEIILERL